jgi:YVTN family beta-propeller protein
MPRRGEDGRALATVLFTDIVGSTELASELGDESWKQVLATHHGVVRKALKRHAGREIDTAGDGFFATFNRPADAIRCAADIIDQLRAVGIQIRAGVHMGEVEQMGGKARKIGGIAVHIGARVASKAGASEILTSSTVRDLVAGSDIRFADRGSYDLKGVPGEWRLFAIDRELTGDVPSKPLVEAPAAKAARRRAIPATTIAVIGIVMAIAAVVVVVFVPDRSPSNVVAVPGPDTVSRIDVEANRFAGTTSVGSAPTEVTSGDGSIWVINSSDQTLSRVDTATGKVVSSRAVGGPPTGVAFGSGSAWVTTQFGLTSGRAGAVLRFDPGTPGVSKVIEVGNGVAAIAFGEGSIWATNTIRNTLVRIDPDTNQVAQTVPVGNSPQAVVAGQGSVWVANTLDRSIWKIDAATGTIGSKISLGSQPTGLALDGDTLWVASQTSNTVTRIDVTNGTTVATVAVGAQPVAIAAGPSGVWVSDEAGHVVERIDPSTNKVVRRLPVRGSPAGLAIVGDAVWVVVRSS